MNKEHDHLLALLDEIDARYEQVEQQISDPAVSREPAKLIALSKERGKNRPVVLKYREYKKMAGELAEAQQIAADETADADLRAMAEEEVEQLTGRKDLLLDELLNTLIMADDMHVDSVIMEIRAGTGGEEAALFARDLYDMYSRYAAGRRWRIEQLDLSPSDMGGFREIIVNVKGEGVWAELGYEGGGHRVQRVPQTEAQGRIHTSAATVAVLPEAQEVDVQIPPSDVIEHVSRSSGPGGQNVNKVSSAIRLEHIPTGITVNMQEESSQHKNRAKAWRILRSRVFELYESQRRAERDSQRRDMIGSGDRSEKIRTYNFPQNRVTDHRIGLSLYNLDKILAGNMGELIEALREHDRQQRLKNLHLAPKAGAPAAQ
ncbi:MAG TPA: peptide chain release factor 1 [Sedimentisphaerales bacterium]|nr:peptide chain release factor 1 [Sedimentisphaerales bacterium]